MRQEVKMLKKYPHAQVIRYIDSFRDRGEIAYLVTELADGSDLKKSMLNRFERKQFFSDAEAKDIIL